MGRHAHNEIVQLGGMALKALADVLGDNRYLMGDTACGADATAFSFVAANLCPLFDSELRKHAQSHANLVAYNERMMEEFYPRLAGAQTA
jgi:glutathione S-transferase